MRLLLDTNIVIYYTLEPDRLSRDVTEMLNEWDNQLYMSAESVKEMIVAYRTKKLGIKAWKNESDMIDALRHEHYITILPVTCEHMETYAKLKLNEADGHNDPSDHIIISHAITEKLPLISSDHKFPFYERQGLELIRNKK